MSWSGGSEIFPRGEVGHKTREVLEVLWESSCLRALSKTVEILNWEEIHSFVRATSQIVGQLDHQREPRKEKLRALLQ